MLTVDLVGYDVRVWLPGATITVEEAVEIPDDITPGTYQVRTC